MFDHAAHLRLALQLLTESDSVDAATARMSAALREKAAAAGHPEKYHHTVTVFWMRMVARLLDKNLPLEYYSRDRLFSDAARTTWLEPDLRHEPSLRSGDSPRHAPGRPVSREPRGAGPVSG